MPTSQSSATAQPGPPSQAADLTRGMADSKPRDSHIGSSSSTSGGKGPITIHTASLKRQFKLRQTFRVSDKLSASIGTAYNPKKESFSPIGSLVYKFDKSSRLEITEEKAFVKKGWDWTRGAISVGISAQCGYTYLGGLDTLHQRKPEVSVSLDYIKPFKYELLGIGLVLLCNLPFKLSNQEFELPLVPPRLKGFVRGSLHRKGWMKYDLSLGEISPVLEL
eukprot:jgi/Chrzof1/3007/Cz12g08010.t1